MAPQPGAEDLKFEKEQAAPQEAAGDAAKNATEGSAATEVAQGLLEDSTEQGAERAVPKLLDLLTKAEKEDGLTRNTIKGIENVLPDIVKTMGESRDKGLAQLAQQLDLLQELSNDSDSNLTMKSKAALQDALMSLGTENGYSSKDVVSAASEAYSRRQERDRRFNAGY